MAVTKNQPKFDVSSIGFIVLDILGRPVAAVPEGGGVEFIEEIRMTVAGTAGATAVDCAVLGLKTRAVAAVGEDDMGDYLINKMTGFGVDCGLVQRVAGVPTSATMLPVRPNGDRPALHVRGTSVAFTVDDKDLDAATDATIVHVGGTGLLKAFDGPPTVALLQHAKAKGCTTTFDLIAVDADAIDIVEPCLPFIDYFVPSIEEASVLSGAENPAIAAAFFQARGAKHVLITLGGEGVHVAPAAGPSFTLPAFDVPVSDTTGCGDSFTAGIIAGIHHGWDLEKSARFASAVAAKIAMGLGSDGKLVSFEDTVRAMETLPVKR
ncbi:MAG: sugar kinase [Pseudomonadota bacterium]